MSETCKWCRGRGTVPPSVDPSLCPVCDRPLGAGPQGMTHALCVMPHQYREHVEKMAAELLSAREALRLVADGEHGESCRARNETLFMGNVRGACEDDCPRSIARRALSPSPKGTPPDR